jgi:type IV fimbrial biogenesis protein FimT
MRNNRGLTLVEMMVVIGVFGLLTAISAPSFFSYLRSNRLETSVNRLTADLQMARSTAIANGRVIQFLAAGNSYRITDTTTGTVLVDRTLETGVAVAADDSTRFFPWGMADAVTFNVGCPAGARTINVLPTGIVEVN